MSSNGSLVDSDSKPFADPPWIHLVSRRCSTDPAFAVFDFANIIEIMNVQIKRIPGSG
jgi:hypothetical protein